MRHDYFPELDGPQSRIEAGGRRILCKGGGGGTSKTTQEIPSELKPLASAYADKAMALSKTGFTPYTGQRFAGLNGMQTGALDMIKDRATQGDKTFNKADSALQQIIGGQSNPYLDQSVQRAHDSVKSNFNTAAVNSGSFGNSGLQEQFTRNLGDVAGQMYGDAYEGDQSRRMQAIGMAPQFANQDYTDAQQLLNAGQVSQDQAQQNADFKYQQFTDKQDLPYKQLAAMSGVFGTNLGSSAKTSQPSGGK